MIDIQKFIRSGGELPDRDLLDMMRALLVSQPVSEQVGWLRQVELSLDGYGGSRLVSAAERVRTAVKQLEFELTRTTH